MNELQSQVEAILFALGRPLSRAEMKSMLQCDSRALEDAIQTLHANSDSRGIALVDDGQMLELRVAAQAGDIVERVRKDEYSRDIGRAGLEVATAILYRGPLTRGEIDFIRGVNSSQTVRTLLMRGLIRKAASSKSTGGRGSFVYEPTTELLATLGLSRVSDLPDYVAVREKITALEIAYRAGGKSDSPDMDTAL